MGAHQREDGTTVSKYQYVVTLSFRPTSIVASYKPVATGRIQAVRAALVEHKRAHGRNAETDFDTIAVVVVHEVFGYPE